MILALPLLLVAQETPGFTIQALAVGDSTGTLFLIWPRNGFLYDQQPDLVTTTSLLRALGDRVNNILAAKLTYWLPLF